MVDVPQYRSGNLKGCKILIVDDDRLNIRILGGIFRSEGYIIASATSGEQALAAYPAFGPDLVMLDVVLPGIDGLETCRTLRQTYGDDCAPVIFITAKNDSEDIVDGLSAGGSDYLPKPFKAKEVIARIRAHLQNQLMANHLKLVADQLSKANAAKNRFLGMAAHDLRNPLGSIRGFAEFLTDGSVGKLTDEQTELVNIIHGASQSMLDMVNELLDVATIESGELRLRSAPHNLREIIEKAVSLTNIEAAKKKTRVGFDSQGIDPVVLIDSAKMRQVVDNLLSNAVKYSPPGSIITVQVSADSSRGVCGFSVRDQGPGIPDNERHKLFKDFGRLSIIPTAGESSTGLGLAICRKIVQAHQGEVTAENLPTRGCEFRVTLPFNS